MTKDPIKVPKLKVKMFPGDAQEDIREFEQAKDLPFLDVFVFVEGQRINSYEEFITIANQDICKDREFLDVMILSAGLVDGG